MKMGGLFLPSPARLAPPSWVRPRDSFLESWEEGIRAPPVVCARKKESTLLQSWILMKKLNLAMAENGKSLEKLGCRRSSRVSSTAPPSSSSLGRVEGSGLSPVAEVDCLEGDLSEVDGGVSSTSLASDAPVVVLGSESCGEEEDFASSTVPVLGNTSTDFRASCAGVLLVGDVQVTLDCPPLLSESLVDVPIIRADSVVATEQADSVKGGGVPSFGGGEEFVNGLADGLVVAGSVEGRQQALVDSGVALRLPSTDGRQQQPPLQAVSSYPMAGVGPEVSSSGYGMRVFPCDGDHLGSDADKGPV
ncbi:hypothetical protein Dimus_018432 [Dionaea muscipula]